jgi:hypothetical protein
VALVLEGKARVAGAGGVRTEGGCEGGHRVGAPPIRTNHARQVGQLVGFSVHTGRGRYHFAPIPNGTQQIGNHGQPDTYPSASGQLRIAHCIKPNRHPVGALVRRTSIGGR